MKNYLALLTLVFVATLSFGQSNYQDYEDVVYLKNGSVIRGLIIEQVPNKSIKIETDDDNLFLFRLDEIEKFTKEPSQRERSNTLSNTGLQTGYKGMIELGYQMGVAEYGMDRLKLNIINAYQINPYFSVGLGTGFRYYFDADATLVPLFVDFTVNFKNANISPYLSLAAGYSFDVTRNYEEVGFLLSPTVGLAYKVSNKTAVYMSFGYEMQRAKFIQYGHYYSIREYTGNTGALSVNMGVSF